MFGENNSAFTTTNNSSDILKSGYDPSQVKGASQIRTQFAKTLNFNPKDSTKTALDETARLAGKYRSMTEMARRVSEQKLEAGQAMLDVYGIALDHANRALDLENNWQRKTKQTLESMSPKMLDMSVNQQQHQGFIEYCDTADKHLKF